MGGEWQVGASLAMEAVPRAGEGSPRPFLQEGYCCRIPPPGVHRIPYVGCALCFFHRGSSRDSCVVHTQKVKESEVWEKRAQGLDQTLGHNTLAYAGLFPDRGCHHPPPYCTITHSRFYGNTSVRDDRRDRIFPPQVGGILVAGLLISFMADVTWSVAEGHPSFTFTWLR